jgi:ABC-2 type transport system ATP-binding protein
MKTRELRVEVHGVGKRFGTRRVFDELSMSLQGGEVLALAGPNGSGKSTLLRILAGLLRADAGAGAVLGDALGYPTRAARRQLGFLPQRAALYPRISVHENLRFRAAVAGLPSPAHAADAAIEALGLADRRREPLARFSGGWIRRIEIAATLIHAPSLLLLDEPTTGVDESSRTAIWEQLRAAAAGDVAIVFSSHDADERRQSTRVLQLGAA